MNARQVATATVLLLGAASPARGQAAPQPQGPPVRAAIEAVLRDLDDRFARGDVDGYLRAFVPDHPGAHAMLGVRLRRALGLGDTPRRTSELLGTPRTIGPRVVADVRSVLTFGGAHEPAGRRIVEQSVVAFRVDRGDGAAVTAVPTFSVDMPPPRAGAAAPRPVGDAFRCPACNYEIGGESGWICVPMPDERAQALEGATFYLVGTDLACDLSVRIADHDATALSTARALAEGMRELDPGTRPGLATAWQPPAHAALVAPEITGARLEATRGDGGVAILHLVQFGGLQHVLLARCSAATWSQRRADLQRLLASYRLLQTDCDFADTAARSLQHHTGGSLTGGRYRNDTHGLELTGPQGWRAEQRSGGAAFRVVWTSPYGSRLWLVGYPVPAGMPRWCTATADRWLEKLCNDAGLEPTAPDGQAAQATAWQPFAPLAAQTRTLRSVPRHIVDPSRPRERLLRAVVRDDLLVVLDAKAADAEDLPVLRAALDALTGTR